MADTGTPLVDSMESVPLPSVAESSAGLNPNEEGAEEAGDGAPKEGVSKSSTKVGKGKSANFQPKNGCQKCCGGFMGFFANDAIYGSFVGPHPVSFMCFCKPCKKCISPSWARPLCVASIATKLMNFIMLGIVAILACFFIIPWKYTPFSSDISNFYSCKGKNMTNEQKNGGCAAHAGYFMLYRCFLAFAFVMLTNFFAMLDVTSTTDDPYRKRIHHGFWMYKYIYLFVWLLVMFLFLNGNSDKTGYFEFTVTILGNIAHVLFSFMILTIILDVLEVWVISMSLSNSGWANFMYSLMTCIIFIVNIILLIAIISHFAFELEFEDIALRRKGAIFDALGKKEITPQQIHDEINARNKTPIPPPASADTVAANKTIIASYVKDSYKPYNIKTEWWLINCLDGTYKNWKTDDLHAGLISAVAITCVLLVLAMALKQRFSKKYPLQGWLQVAVIILFDLFYLWSGLFNSPKIESRPRCNWALNKHADLTNVNNTPYTEIVSGAHDTYFRYSGFLHGMLIVFALLYFAFVHGPRTKSAPLSLAYRHFFAGGYDRVPVYPDPQNSPPEFKQAVEQLEVWDDETEKVAQSWSIFYFMMVVGSLSLMMAMTNFTDPWAEARYNSSKLAMHFKICTAIGATLAYTCMLTCPCTRAYKAYEVPKRKRRVVKKVVTEDQAEAQMEEPEVYEEEEEAWY